MLLLIAILLVVAVVKLAEEYRQRVLSKEERPAARLGFLAWLAKGIVFPLCLWILLNCGISGRFPPIIPEVGMAGARWPGVLIGTIPAALFLIASWWSAISAGWLMALLAGKIEEGNRRDLALACLGWSGVAVPVALVIVWAGGWPAVGFALVAWLLPLTYTMLLSIKEEISAPSYSAAIAKVKFGKYDEAESEVIRQLEKCQDDFDGWMMLAELYATHFSDLPSAHQTVLDLCAQPNTNASQISVALHRLADWHLANEDPEAARRALQLICDRLPDTHLDRMARLRIRQLPASRDELREQKARRPIRIPHLGQGEDRT